MAPPGVTLGFKSDQDNTAWEGRTKNLQDPALQEKTSEKTGDKVSKACDAPQAIALPEAPLSEESNRPSKDSHATTNVGKGLESIGDMVLNSFQPLATVVGEVVKAPAALIAKVDGLSSKQEENGTLENLNSPTTPRGTPLLERLVQLEQQMTMIEERYSPKAVAAQLSSSTPSLLTTPSSLEKLRTAKSVLQETEVKGTLVERVQMLEKRISEHKVSLEMAFPSIQLSSSDVDSSQLETEQLVTDHLHDISKEQDNLAVGHDTIDTETGSLQVTEMPVEEPREESVTSLGDESTLQEPHAEELTAEPVAEPAEPERAEDAGEIGSAPMIAEPLVASTPQDPQKVDSLEGGGLKDPQVDLALDGKQTTLTTQMEVQHKSTEDNKVPPQAPEAQGYYVAPPQPVGKTENRKKEKKEDETAEGKRNKQHFKNFRHKFRQAFRSKQES